MNLDNLVTREINAAEFPASWKIVILRRSIPRLFKNDDVEYLGQRWRVFDIRGGSKQLVLRPL